MQPSRNDCRKQIPLYLHDSFPYNVWVYTPLRLALYHILSMFITVNMALTPEFLSLLLVYIQIFAGEFPIWLAFDWYYIHILYPINLHNIVGMISISPGEIPICKSSSHPVIRHLGAPNSVHGLVVEAPVLRTISLHQI